MKMLWLRPSTGDNVSLRRERIAERLRKRGVEVDIQDSSGLDAISAARISLLGDYDVIAGNVRMGLFIGYPLARLLRKPFIGDVSDTLSDIRNLPTPVFELLASFEWFVLKRAEAAVFVYKSSYREAIKKGIESAVRLPNAVDYEMFSSPKEDAIEQSQEILTECGVDFQKPMAIYIGRFTDNYHITDIIETARMTPTWDFVFLGEGELADHVVSASHEITNVYYPGSFEYRLMPGFLSYADAGFCFKDAEQPLKLKEYGAARVPVIAQPGELQNFYNESELIFVEPEAGCISEALNEIVTGEVDVARNLQKRVSEHSWEKIADGYHSVLRELVNEDGPMD